MINAYAQKIDSTPSPGTKTVVLLLAGATTSIIALTVQPSTIPLRMEPAHAYINTIGTTSPAVDTITYIDPNKLVQNSNDSYLEGYVKNITASIEDLRVNGAIEIPKSILTADDFYDWLHKE